MEEKKTNTQETSAVEDNKKGSEKMKMIGKIIIGLVIILLGLWALIGWWKDFVVLFKGGIGLVLILVGLIVVMLAKE